MGGWVDGWMRVEGFVRAKRKFASQIFCSKLSIDGGMDVGTYMGGGEREARMEDCWWRLGLSLSDCSSYRGSCCLCCPCSIGSGSRNSNTDI